MKIESAAGEFEFDVQRLSVSAGHLVVTGKMGVWEAETTMNHSDIAKMLRLTLGSPAIWLFLIKSPLFMFRKTGANEISAGAETK